MAELIDITKMGPQTYSQLQEQNDLSKNAVYLLIFLLILSKDF